jgi:hypothetical protein
MVLNFKVIKFFPVSRLLDLFLRVRVMKGWAQQDEDTSFYFWCCFFAWPILYSSPCAPSMERRESRHQLKSFSQCKKFRTELVLNLKSIPGSDTSVFGVVILSSLEMLISVICWVTGKAATGTFLFEFKQTIIFKDVKGTIFWDKLSIQL